MESPFSTYRFPPILEMSRVLSKPTAFLSPRRRYVRLNRWTSHEIQVALLIGLIFGLSISSILFFSLVPWPENDSKSTFNQKDPIIKNQLITIYHRWQKKHDRDLEIASKAIIARKSKVLNGNEAYFQRAKEVMESMRDQSLNNSVEINPIDRRIVILAGPHKTATTSIQTNLLKWSFNRTSPIIGKNWSWVQPNTTCLKKLSNAKQYANLYGPKEWAPVPRCIFEHKNRSSIMCKELFGCYQDSLSMYMSIGNNIVYGAEAFARTIVTMVRESETYTMEIVESQLNLIKAANVASSNVWSYSTISWVVTYRAPKYQHLVSVWHQLRDLPSPSLRKKFNNTKFTLRAYLSSTYFNLDSVDPLLTAVKLAQYPYSDDSIRVQVVILDMSGVNQTSKDISLVVACEIVSASPCHQENYTSVRPSQKNQREDDGLNDLTNHEIFQIESILQRLDCNSAREIRSNPRIRVMYSFLLEDVLSKCDPKHSPYSHEDAIRDIREIFNKTRLIK